MGLLSRRPLFEDVVARFIHARPWSAAYRMETGGDLRIRGQVWVPGQGRVTLGRGVRIIGRRAPVELRAHAGAEIVIEDNVLIEDGTSIEATRSIRIGARSRIGAFCKIIDNHFHHVVGNRAERPDPIAIVIGEDVTLGSRAVLLPGARVGAGAFVGPARVLSFHLPAGMDLANGMPNTP